MNRALLPEVVVETRVIAVLRGLNPDRVDTVTHILREAGIGAIEVTMDSPEAAKSIERLAHTAVSVGAGTVMSVAEAEVARAAGATFLVAPHTDPTVARWAVERGIPMIPGAFTPTEVVAAWNLGVAAVKVFPASVGGPGLLKALRGPLGGLPLIPTGGVTADNAAEFLSAGAVAVGLGGWLTGHSDLGVIAERAALTVQACQR
jgi:2-dehydro-3-deoxyphosphogluconate aldolase/(4S)-4-hydroxy-2-oxoglutarate aldolase